MPLDPDQLFSPEGQGPDDAPDTDVPRAAQAVPPRASGSHRALQPTPSSPRVTGSQRALQPPDAPPPPRASGSQRAVPAPDPAARVSGSHRAHPGVDPALKVTTPATANPLATPAPGAPRTSNPAMRRVSNPALPRVGNTGANAAHHLDRPGVLDEKTSPGLKNKNAAAAADPTTAVPTGRKAEKKKSGRPILFALAVALLAGVGVVWVVLHPEKFPGASTAEPEAPKRLPKPPMLAKAPPKDPPPAAAEPPKAVAEPEKAPEAAPPEPAKEPAEPAKPAHHAKKTRVAADKPEPEEAAPAPRVEKPAPTAGQISEGIARCETLLAKQESLQGPDPVLREFLTKVKAEAQGAESDDQRRQVSDHLSQLQRRLGR